MHPVWQLRSHDRTKDLWCQNGGFLEKNVSISCASAEKKDTAQWEEQCVYDPEMKQLKLDSG